MTSLQILELLSGGGERGRIEEGSKGGVEKRKKEFFLPFLFLSLATALPPPSSNPSPPTPKAPESLVTRLLLLLAEQRPQRDAGHFHDLEPDARDVADGVAAAAETRNEDLVLLS